MQRQAFTQVLELLLSSGSVWILSTMRSDFYHRCAELPTLVHLLEGNGQYLLTPPSLAEIGQIIRMPAHAAGLQFATNDSGIRLDEVILEAMANSPESLALLEFTLDALYQKRAEKWLFNP